MNKRRGCDCLDVDELGDLPAGHFPDCPQAAAPQRPRFGIWAKLAAWAAGLGGVYWLMCWTTGGLPQLRCDGQGDDAAGAAAFFAGRPVQLAGRAADAAGQGPDGPCLRFATIQLRQGAVFKLPAPGQVQGVRVQWADGPTVALDLLKQQGDSGQWALQAGRRPTGIVLLDGQPVFQFDDGQSLAWAWHLMRAAQPARPAMPVRPFGK